MSRALRLTPLRGLTTTTTTTTRTRLFSTAAPSSHPTLPVRVTGTGTGTIQQVAVPGKAYTFTADTYPLLGGADSAPSPVVYALASLASCNQVTGHVVARDHGIALGEWHVDVEGALPTGVLVHGEEAGNPNWEAVRLRVRVQTDAAEGGPEWERFVAEVERRCPITRLFRDSGVKWESEWVNEKLG